MEEEWRPVAGYEEHYQVSDRGVVYSIRRKRLMRPSIDRTGYLHLSLYGRGTKKTFRIHTLTAQAFLGERPDGHVINHKDGVKTNNPASNLEYVTPAENVDHAINTGLTRRNRKKKLTDSMVVDIRARASTVPLPHLALEYGVHVSHIMRVVSLAARSSV